MGNQCYNDKSDNDLVLETFSSKKKFDKNNYGGEDKNTKDTYPHDSDSAIKPNKYSNRI